MVSNAKCGSPMGRGHGGRADLPAQQLGVVGRDAGEVLDLVEVGGHARLEFVEAGREIGELQLHEAVVVAEAAIGFAPEGEGEGCFSVEQEMRDAIRHSGAGLAAAHETEAFVDQRNHEQPEAREQTAKGRKVAQQPGWDAAFVLHGQGLYARFWPYRF
jgi:hypothetical protein